MDRHGVISPWPPPRRTGYRQDRRNGPQGPVSQDSKAEDKVPVTEPGGAESLDEEKSTTGSKDPDETDSSPSHFGARLQSLGK